MKTKKPIPDLATQIAIKTWGNVDENDDDQINSVMRLFDLTKEEVIAGTNIVKAENVLHKFRNKEKIRAYNFNLDIDSALSVLSSKNINKIILVSKNVCHSELNCIGKLHKDLFLFKYKLDSGKRLHDLLMVKEGVNFISGNNTICNYEQIKSICERRVPDNMSIWGSELSNTSTIFISTALFKI